MVKGKCISIVLFEVKKRKRKNLNEGEKTNLIIEK